MVLMRAILLSCLCIIPLHGMRKDDIDLGQFNTEGQLAVRDTIFAEEEAQEAIHEDPPQCPVEIPKEHDGDPEKKWCCASGAKMFDRRSFTMPMPAGLGDTKEMSFWMNNGCKVCADVEKRFEVYNVKVKKFPSKTKTASTLILGTYADLDPKIAPEKGPLYLPDLTFNPVHQYVLYLYTKSDHNGAFRFTSNLCGRLDCWASRGYEVVMRQIGTKAEANRVLDQFPDDSLHHVVLSGHGTSFLLAWGDGWDGQLIKGSSGTAKFLKHLREKIRINGTVLLDACLNAQDRAFGLQNLFEYVASKLPGRQVTASKISLSDPMWESVQAGEDPREVVEGAEDDFDETCQAGDRVKFVSNGTDQTAIRKRGRPNCKELKLDEIEIFDSCLSRCRSSCSDVWKKDWNKDDRKNAPYKLLADEAAAEQIVKKDLNPCWFGKKMVCKIQKESSKPMMKMP